MKSFKPEMNPFAFRWTFPFALLLVSALSGCRSLPLGQNPASSHSEESIGTVAQSASTVIELTPAADLPDREADLIGGFLRQDGDMITVGSGFTDIGPDGNGGFRTQHDGPVIIVASNASTRFFKDSTDVGANSASSSQLHLQQTVTELEPPVQIPYPAFISVWGERLDDQLLAEAILFNVPGS